MTAQALTEKTRAATMPRSRAPAARPSGLADLLRVPGIIRLSISNGLVQGFGNRMQGVVVAWLVLEMTDSKFWLGVVNGVPVLPVLLFSLLGGVVADTRNAKRVMVVSRVALAVIAFATAALVATDQIAIGHLLLYVLLVVGIAAIDMPVARNYLFGVVGGPRLLGANALQQVIMNTITIVMPVSAGLLIGFGGPQTAFLLLGIGYAVAVVLILNTPASSGEDQASKGTNPLADVLAGIAYIRATPAVSALVCLAFLVPVAGIYFAMVPVFAREVLDVGAGGLGILVASFSAGGLAGSAYLAAGRGLQRRGLKLTVLGVAFGVGMMAFALSQSFLLSCAISLVMGVLAAFWQNILGVMIQVVAAPEMRGRVTSVFTMGFQLVGLGWLAGGSLAAVLGVEAAVVLGGIVFSGLSLAIFLVSPDVRHMD
jgi:hypothetical protein